MLTQIMGAIAQDIDTIVKQAMTAVKLQDSNLYKELEVIADDNEGDLVFGIILNDYVEYVESGRRSGKMPPLQPIEDWCKRHGIPTNNSVLYAIRKMIGEEGIRPRPFLDEVFQEIDKKWNNEWSDAIFDDIMKIIDNFFNL